MKGSGSNLQLLFVIVSAFVLVGAGTARITLAAGTEQAPKNSDRLCDRSLSIDAFSKAFAPDKTKPENWVLITDFPTLEHPASSENWIERIEMLRAWKEGIEKEYAGHTVSIYGVPFSGSHNAGLGESLYPLARGTNFSKTGIPVDQVLKTANLVIASSEYSMTAPLKNYGKDYRFRGATMPGFNSKMLDALNVDLVKVIESTRAVQAILDQAVALEMDFIVGGVDAYEFRVDLTDRKCHLSDCQMREPGEVKNLPSGETFIVPYEGEKPGVVSKTSGLIPVQIGKEIVVYRILGNKTVEIIGDGPEAIAERLKLASDPAYGNIAEIGFGVLDSLGVKPLLNDDNAILINEKLGVHIAWGRSDHFGGFVGPKDFKGTPVHLDRVFISALMPKVRIRVIDAVLPDGRKIRMMSNDLYSQAILSPSSKPFITH